MEDVSGCAFREMFVHYGKPDVMFTEFVSVDGLLHPQARRKLLMRLKFTQKQRPIVAQLWGNDPEKFYQAAKIISKLQFDGLDINMGCPKSREMKLKACAYLIRQPFLAQAIIAAVKKGAGVLPVSVKTRIGYSKPETEKWIKALLKAKPAAIIVHGRTRQETSKVPAHWDEIAKAVKMRDKLKSQTLIIGNGDVQSRKDGLARARQSGVDGVMVGRAALGNPWIFNPRYSYNPERIVRRSLLVPRSFSEGGGEGGFNGEQISVQQRLQALLQHVRLFEKYHKNQKPFVVMRKHMKAYVSGFSGAAELRAKLMQTKNPAQAESITKDFLRAYGKSSLIKLPLFKT